MDNTAALTERAYNAPAVKTYLPFLITFLSGGFAGSLFTWWVNRPDPTVITYSVTTTSLGADATVRGLVPGLQLQINDVEVPVIHTHTVEFAAPQGAYLDKAEIAVTFSANVKFFGKILAEPPSPVHHINCTDLPNGSQCTMGPFDPGDSSGRFRVVMATDQQQAPSSVMAVRNARLIQTDKFAQGRLGIFESSIVQSFIGTLGLFAILLTLPVFVPILIRTIREL